MILLSLYEFCCADNIIVPEPEPAEGVKICDAYGAGYFYIPGTETCIRIGGQITSTIRGGTAVHDRGFTYRRGRPVLKNSNKQDTLHNISRFRLSATTASETELGTLKTYTETRYSWHNGRRTKASGSLYYGYVELGGLQIGLGSSAFASFISNWGGVDNSDVIMDGGNRTGLISYKFTHDNGVSAILSLEQGSNKATDSAYGYYGTISAYTPHVIGGLKYEPKWGTIIAVIAYDSRNEEWAGKVRGNLKVTDQLSLWAMGGYKSNKDIYMDVMDNTGQVAGQARVINSFYGQWGGDWAAWCGIIFKATDKTTLNAELAYDATYNFYATANVTYNFLPGFTIKPKISYVHWQDDRSIQYDKDGWRGLITFQRSF